jgi:hypothetical protein
MQSCLNEDHAHLQRDFRKYPFLWVITAGLVIFTILFSVIGYFCLASWRCPEGMGPIFTIIGVTLILFFIAFIALPYLVLILLNCCFPLSDADTEVEEYAYNEYVNPLQPGRARSGSKTKNRREELV